MAALLQEIPCRDTDPLPRDEEELESSRDSPVAFTINFGFGEDSELAKEKARKLERFALRSSLRKPKSPRNAQTTEKTSEQTEKTSIEIMRKSFTSVHKPKLSREGSFVREKSNLSYKSTEKSRMKSVTKSVINGFKSPPAKSPSERPKEETNQTNGDNFTRRRLTTTLSPEESKMISHFEKEIEAHSLEIVETGYENDHFEHEDEEDDIEEQDELAPSETGTYTVGKEEGLKPSSADKARVDLESLVGAASGGRSNYVEDWATRHASRGVHSAPSLRPTLIPSPQSSSGSGKDGAGAFSPLGTKSSLSKSRRRLPATPGLSAEPVSPDNLNFSPESDSPSPLQESDEGECSYMKHTQRLVDVMEARINQKTSRGSLLNTSSGSLLNRTVRSKTSLKKTISSPPSNMEGVVQDAKEAWQRRKNYDPLAASGRKKDSTKCEITRKISSSSLISAKTSRDETNGSSSTIRLEERMLSGKSGSSDSSGYFSRGDGGRFSIRGSQPIRGGSGSRSNVKAPFIKPQSKLLTSHSAAEIKQNSSRSSSSLTSKEAEFQAWKRRKNYDPLKSAAANSSSSRKSASPKSAYSPSPTSQLSSIPQHMRNQDMTQSLVQPDSSDDGAPMQRSASFHYENARLRALTSEDDSTEDYVSGCESPHMEGGPRHYYLDEDELILPIYPSSSQRSIYAHKSLSLSPKISPSRSRSRLEALDNLVISTIYSVSSKLCSNTNNVLRKAGQSFPPIDEDQATTLETVLYLLEDVDLPSSPAKKTSRELSGTLRNLKKVEQALEMLSKLMDNDDSEAS